jgi:NNP family nitrate/nitrite transporter-like MFS transporter
VAGPDGKAVRINLLSFAQPQMRAFHVTWLAFFLAFFGWFGIAPLMAVVRDDLGLTKAQVGNTVIASVAATIAARLVIGWAADRYGPRISYSVLLVFGSIPVMLIGLADSYESFLLFRLAIGIIGASFVLTQYHTSRMFEPNVVGTANATTAGWGNLGGGVTQMVMPLVLSAVLMLGVSEAAGWRVAMVVPGIALFIMGIAYYFLTQDAPGGNFKELRASGHMPPASAARGSFMEAAKDQRVWALFAIYGACFGIELTINNVAALYFHDRFGLSVGTAGLIAGLFGLMNLFARSLGGSDPAGRVGADAVFADGSARSGHPGDDHLQHLRPDV